MTKEWSQRGYESSVLASRYIDFRPKPPARLADRIVEFLKEKYTGDLSVCVDAGCGSGQCSLLLSSHFQKVLATDISASQIEVAKSRNHPSNIEFVASPAEQCPVEDGSVQLVNACVAAHWFDLPAFFKESDRILCSNGIVAIAAYVPLLEFVHPTASEELGEAMKLFYRVRLRDYWAKGVSIVDNEYKSITIPYEDFVREVFYVDECRKLSDLMNFFSSWCIYNNYCEVNGEAAGKGILEEFANNCLKALGSTQEPHEVDINFKFKYVLLMAHKP
ncbi:putative methyltransferase DDB_G0268948 [Daphnia pulicaria]|uniref:putative methyltransferase DDB_G0268948 n=1 Tax=Daphnia pulicaria TaxID=35523 RepID=UPI001EEA5EFB|nr:putative methyltransferase DDB_G0268948 [Daphnia pulicaria]